MRGSDKKPGNLPVGRSKGFAAKKGNSTRETAKKRPTARFYEVKIRIPAEEYIRGLPYFDEQKYLPKFFMDAYTEKVNRAEANNKAARLRILAGNVELLDPIIKEMHDSGKLNYLINHIMELIKREGENG